MPSTLTCDAVRSYRTISPLPPPFGWGGIFSVALSVASPRLDVIQPAARESSDFPPRVNGAILSNKVVLHSTAEVEGDVAAQFLSIEQGASFDGRSRRVRDPSEIAPQTEPVTTPTAQDRPVQSYQPQTSGYSEHLNGSSASKTTPIYS